MAAMLLLRTLWMIRLSSCRSRFGAANCRLAVETETLISREG